jgi:hypothetical protein
MGSRTYAGVLQQMNEFPQSAVVTAVRHCSFEGAFEAAANRTLPGAISVRLRISRQNAFSADGTNLPFDGMNPGQAIGTHG